MRNRKELHRVEISEQSMIAPSTSWQLRFGEVISVNRCGSREIDPLHYQGRRWGGPEVEIFAQPIRDYATRDQGQLRGLHPPIK